MTSVDPNRPVTTSLSFFPSWLLAQLMWAPHSFLLTIVIKYSLGRTTPIRDRWTFCPFLSFKWLCIFYFHCFPFQCLIRSTEEFAVCFDIVNLCNKWAVLNVEPLALEEHSFDRWKIQIFILNSIVKTASEKHVVKRQELFYSSSRKMSLGLANVYTK